MKEENKNNKKSYLIFAVIAIILLLLYNSFIIPAIKKAQIKGIGQGIEHKHHKQKGGRGQQGIAPQAPAPAASQPGARCGQRCAAAPKKRIAQMLLSSRRMAPRHRAAEPSRFFRSISPSGSGPWPGTPPWRCPHPWCRPGSDPAYR